MAGDRQGTAFAAPMQGRGPRRLPPRFACIQAVPFLLFPLVAYCLATCLVRAVSTFVPKISLGLRGAGQPPLNKAEQPSAARALRVANRAFRITQEAQKALAEEEEEEEDEEEVVEEEEKKRLRTPVLYEWSHIYERISSVSRDPGHLVQRKWLRKGKNLGYVTLPFATSVKKILPEDDVNICLVSRREWSDKVAKAWQSVLDGLPLFDESGELLAPRDLDPMEPPWDVPLDEPLPSDEEVRAMLHEQGVLEQMEERLKRPAEELARRGAEHHGEDAPDATVLRQLLRGLPSELRTPNFRTLIRSTVVEILKLAWVVHMTSGASKLRWRVACTEDDVTQTQKPETEMEMRAYYLLAGEGLDFVPRNLVDRERVRAANRLSEEQLRRTSSEDWAIEVSALGTNSSEALKTVPAGWSVFLKGDLWKGLEEERGAIFRLPFSGKRIFIQVDVVGGRYIPPAAADEGLSGAEPGSSGSALGPIVAGLGALLLGYIRNTPPFRYGQERRRELDEVLRALTVVSGTAGGSEAEEAKSLRDFEQRLWMDFADPEDAPVVLVVGGETETGLVVSRKLVSSGYHVVLLKVDKDGQTLQTERFTRTERFTPQGSLLASAEVEQDMDPVYERHLPKNLYDAVAGIDKLVICACDADRDSRASLKGQQVTNILAGWQIYRSDFAEKQRAYSSKVRLFDFQRDTDFELWDVERGKSSDVRYGRLRQGWARNSNGNAMFIGSFYEPLGQTHLQSPVLKLNFKRFSGLICRFYNQAVDNTYSFFLRTPMFEETRLQYEVDFTCKASRWCNVRMPFNSFRLVRVDGVPVPEEDAENFPLDRAEVVQMGIAARTGENPVPYGDTGVLNYFSLAFTWVKAYRTQTEPQVVYVGNDPVGVGGETDAEAEEDDEEEEEEELDVWAKVEADLQRIQAEERAARELEKLVRNDEVEYEEDSDEEGEEKKSDGAILVLKDGEEEGGGGEDGGGDVENPKTAVQAVVSSGLAYTIIKVSGVNEHPGGRFPIIVRQDPNTDPPLRHGSARRLPKISRGDIAELVVSALTQPSCVNAEMAAGEIVRGEVPEGPIYDYEVAPSFRIDSTLQEDVKLYMAQLKPNK